VGGANTAEWDLAQRGWQPPASSLSETAPASVGELLAGAGGLLLQREVPEHVSLEAARASHYLGFMGKKTLNGKSPPKSHGQAPR
jgi:hypothetical protein